MRPVSKALRRDVDSHFIQGHLHYTVFADEKVIGFAIFNHYKTEGILYLSGIILHESFQGKDIAREVVKLAKQDTQTSFLVLRTQSLRMWAAADRMVERIFPHPLQRTPLYLRMKVSQASYIIGMGGQIIAPHFYGAPLYGEKPVHSNTTIQDWWDDICDFQRGDAVLCIGAF